MGREIMQFLLLLEGGPLLRGSFAARTFQSGYFLEANG
jgi:hypothetical protein